MFGTNIKLPILRPKDSLLLPGLLLFLTLLTSTAAAQFGGEERPIEINGYLLTHISGRAIDQYRLEDEEKKDSDYLLGEERLRLDVYTWSESVEASARIKVDFVNSELADDSSIDVREAFVDYTTGDFDLRLGRQVITWGVGDLVFINDVFPKDWVSFFAGRPLEYLKLGSEGFRIRYSSSILNGELLALPFFRPDEAPDSDTFFMYDPTSAIEEQTEVMPRNDFENIELAARLYRRLGNYDLSAYSYKGFYHLPSAQVNMISPTQISLEKFYPRLYVNGLSLQTTLLGGVTSLEAGYHFSRDDDEGDDPLIPNSEKRFLVGYQRQLWTDSNFGVQYYDEAIEQYEAYLDELPDGYPKKRAHRNTLTLRLEQFLLHQTWHLSMFSFYSPVDADSLLQPKATYKFSDNLAGTMGANIFGGVQDENDDDPTFLAQFDKNDNLYLSLRFDF